MTELVLGPVLRHVGERDAVVWVETQASLPRLHQVVISPLRNALVPRKRRGVLERRL